MLFTYILKEKREETERNGSEMKKFIGFILGAILLLVLGAVGICIPTYLQWKEIQDNASFQADYTLESVDSDFNRIAQLLELGSGRVTGYDCGDGLWYLQIYDAAKDAPCTELYVQSKDLEDSYVNVTMLGNTAVSSIGEKIPLLKDFLKEGESSRYLSLGQFQEITGLVLPIQEINKLQKKVLPYVNLFPLIRLLPCAYKEDGYRYYQFSDVSDQYTVGIADLGTENKGVNVQVNVEGNGVEAKVTIWLKAAQTQPRTLPGSEQLLGDNEIKLMEQVCTLMKSLF